MAANIINVIHITKSVKQKPFLNVAYNQKEIELSNGETSTYQNH